MTTAARHARFQLAAGMLAIGVTAAMASLLVRVAQLQLRPSERLAGQMTPRVSTKPEPALRGDILDRKSRILAATRFGFRVVVDPTLLDPAKLDQSIVQLASAIGRPADEIGTRIISALDENRRRAAGLGITPTEEEVFGQGDALLPDATSGKPRGPIRFLPMSGILSDSQAAAVQYLRLKGISLEKRQVREYPGGPEVASILGKFGFEDTGMMGAERLLNSDLAGQSGAIRYVRDANGRPLWMDPGSVTPASAGMDVRLSIDLEIQRFGTEELNRAIDAAGAAGGRLVIADPNTGEILAMVDIVRDLPGLTPFPWVDATPRKRGERAPTDPPLPKARFVVIAEDRGRKIHPALARNRCIEDIYEPGSTFKPFVWSTITELGRARLDEDFDTHNGRWTIPGMGRYIEDVTKRSHMTWRDVLVNSSNIGMIQGAARLSPQELHDTILRFGFGKRTGVGLPGRPFPGEAAGIVTPLSKWSKFTHTSVPWGHEVAVTPVQMVRAFSAFARRGPMAGTLPRLRLSAYVPEDGEGVTYRVLPSEISLLTREIMQGVVANMEQGMKTRKEEIPEDGWRYSMFGKSGTADIPLGPPPKGKRAPTTAKGFYPGQLNTSFIAAGPTEDPRIVVIVVIDDPAPKPDRRHMYGSATAGPAVRRIMDRTLTYLGVPPTPKPVAEGGPQQ
ncbi:cell division protein FtsI (penicillin-binding protein 3) [Phycisphaerales bacterium]|nr:cell division protein FtsI (penicillin-binding protein 3) [Phycisphaerales bacterium]